MFYCEGIVSVSKMDSNLITSLASFAGVLLLLCLTYKKILKVITSGIDGVKNQQNTMEKELESVLSTIAKYEEDLKLVKSHAERKIADIQADSDKAIADEKRAIQKYYKEKQVEIKKIITDLKQKNVLDINKEAVKKALDIINSTPDKDSASGSGRLN